MIYLPIVLIIATKLYFVILKPENMVIYNGRKVASLALFKGLNYLICVLCTPSKLALGNINDSKRFDINRYYIKLALGSINVYK